MENSRSDKKLFIESPILSRLGKMEIPLSPQPLEKPDCTNVWTATKDKWPLLCGVYVGGDVIQANYDTSCEHATPPCPFQYSSDEVYKYTICIETMIEDQSTTEPPSTTLSTLDPNEDKSPYLLELPLIVMFAVLLIFLACCVIYRKCKKQEAPMSTMEEVHFIRKENV